MSSCFEDGKKISVFIKRAEFLDSLSANISVSETNFLRRFRVMSQMPKMTLRRTVAVIIANCISHASVYIARRLDKIHAAS
jgi:hypothetical protein